MTAAISSRSSVLPEAVQTDAIPTEKAAVPTHAPETNRVQAWKGEALKGAPTSDAVLKQVDQKMNRGSFQGVRDFFVTEQAARESVALLGQLSTKDYQRALNDMRPDTMTKLMSEMDPDTRKAFFQQAQTKGVLVEEAGVKMPPLAGNPPDGPALIRNERHLPNALRVAIHAENEGRAHAYMKDFEAYVGRYSELALKAESPLALRKMGPPAREVLLQEGGVTFGDEVVPPTLHQGASVRVRAAQAANDRISDFAGRPRAGSYTLTVEAKFRAEMGGFGVENASELKVSDSGQVKTKSSSEGDVKVLPGVKVGVDANGRGFTELGSKHTHVRYENGKLAEMEGLGVKLTKDKTVFSTKAAGPVGVWAAVDEKHGSYGGGVKVGSDLDVGFAKVEASVKIGVMVQGVSPERLPAIGCMRDDGIWGPMPELNGTKWEAIPAERRKRLASDGWTAGNWPVR